MNALPAIIALKLDIGIKNRVKKKFNGRHQFKNPFVGDADKFERPEKCREVHKDQSKGLNCMKVNREDVTDFRLKLYKTDEKRDQNDFLYNFITPKQCKIQKNYKGKKMFTINYFMQKKSGQVIEICQRLFEAITGFGQGKIRVIYLKKYKDQLLEKGDESLFQPVRSRFKELDEKIKEKKEKLLNLEKGTLESFAKSITGIDPNFLEEKPDAPSLKINPNLAKKKTKTYNTKKPKILQQIKMEPEEFPNLRRQTRTSKNKDIKEEVEPPETRNFLKLSAMEVCRVCVKYHHDLINIFNKKRYEDYTPAHLLEYGLSISINYEDSLPKKICPRCFESVKIACSLKYEWEESQKLMETCVGELKEFKIKSFNEVLDFYSDKEEEENQDLEEILMKEEGESEDEYPKDQEQQENFLDDEEDVMEVSETQDPELIEFDSDSENEEKTVEVPKKSNNCDLYVGLKPRMCYLCNENFETTPEDHFQNKHPLISFERCKKCLFETSYPWFMNLHQQIHLDDYKLCTICGKTFYGLAEYQTHHSICSGRRKFLAKNKIISCQFCGQRFPSYFTRNRHVRVTHTKQKNYKCSECDELFYARIHMRRHMKSKHKIGSSVCCQKCGKDYLQQYLLNRHMKYCLKD